MDDCSRINEFRNALRNGMISSRGRYEKDGRIVKLKLLEKEHGERIALMPDELIKLAKEEKRNIPLHVLTSLYVGVEKKSPLFTAMECFGENPAGDSRRVLIVKFVAPEVMESVYLLEKWPEEELLYRTTLREACGKKNPLWKYNTADKKPYGTDAMLLCPKVEILENEEGMLDTTQVIGVLAVAFPAAVKKDDEREKKTITKILRRRICLALHVAAVYDYAFIISETWNYGKCGIETADIARIYSEELMLFKRGINWKGDFFKEMIFAIPEEKEYDCFNTVFPKNDNDREPENIRRKREKWQDTIRGGLIGGVIGDVVGTPAAPLTSEEFLGKEKESDGERTATRGVRYPEGKIKLSGNSQRILFIATGILNCETFARMHGTADPTSLYIWLALQDWDTSSYMWLPPEHRHSWLAEYSALSRHHDELDSVWREVLKGGKAGSMKAP